MTLAVLTGCSSSKDSSDATPAAGEIKKWDAATRQITVRFDGYPEQSAYLFSTADERKGRYWLGPAHPPEPPAFGAIDPATDPYEWGLGIRRTLTLLLPSVDLSEAEICLHLDRTECVELGEKYSA